MRKRKKTPPSFARGNHLIGRRGKGEGGYCVVERADGGYASIHIFLHRRMIHILPFNKQEID